jgi:hypothetical protein
MDVEDEVIVSGLQCAAADARHGTLRIAYRIHVDGRL